MASFSEKVIVEALDARDWDALRTELERSELDEESAEKLVRHVLQARKLVFRYPGPVKKREKILDGVVDYIRCRIGDAFANRAAESFAVFPLIDQGYAGLRELIGANPLAARAPTERLSALLESLATQADILREMALRPRNQEVFSTQVIVGDAEHGQFNLDNATVKFVEFATMGVMIEAHTAKWIGKDSIIRVPNLPLVCNGDDITAAAASLSTAWAWQQWQRIDEQVRYFGDTLAYIPATEIDEALPPKGQVLQHGNESLDWYTQDAIANERLGDRLLQAYLEFLEELDGNIEYGGLSSRSSIMPEAHLSTEEVHSAIMLSEFLGFDTATDSTEYGGLTLMEWLRGYAVLQLAARRAAACASTPQERWFPRFRISQLHGLLRRKGLVGRKASDFVDLVSLSESSRDLYDAPLLRSAGDTCILAGLAMNDALLLRFLLSTFNTKGYKIEQKGRKFEEYMRSYLRGQGLRVEHVKTNRDDAEIEIDALVPWGPYLFLFECKNRSLSANSTVMSYRFRAEVASSVRQVKRLVSALEAHPDIVVNSLSADCVGLHIVPVVLHSMPFSIPGGMDGVYFSDASGLTRFFRKRFVSASSVHRVQNRLHRHTIPTYALWQGDRPSPEDLLSQLSKPIQVEMLRREIAVEPLTVQIGPELFAATARPRRNAPSLETMLAGTALTADMVRSEFKRFEQEMVRPLRQRVGDGVARTEKSQKRWTDRGARTSRPT